MYWSVAATYVKGDHTIKVGANNRWGTFRHTRDGNADLRQQYRSSRPACAGPCPTSVLIANYPLVFGEKLNRDLGIYAQDSWRLNRLTANIGLRWETLNSSVMAGESPAGRFVPARTFPEIKDVPDWNDFAPRMALVYDLFGNGRTAIKYSLNRYNLSRTTGIAANYNPLRTETATLPWRDVNGNDIADGALRCTGYPSAACEIDFTSLAPNFGIAALNEYGQYPRTWNLESGLEIQHELFSGVSISGSWWKGDFRNLTTTINRSYTTADYTPFTFYNPTTGQPFEVYARTLEDRGRRATSTRSIRNARTATRRSTSRAGGAFPAAARCSAASPTSASASRTAPRLTTPTTAATARRLCDEYVLDIPYRPSCETVGDADDRHGASTSAWRSRTTPARPARALMAATRGSTRYPANCPAPCPAGQIIMPAAVFGQTTLTYNLEPVRATSVERIVQLDFKVSRTFRFGRFSVLPTFEVFNINNSDAIISYISTNVLSASYLSPNSIMQGRMYGLGLVTRW